MNKAVLVLLFIFLEIFAFSQTVDKIIETDLQIPILPGLKDSNSYGFFILDKNISGLTNMLFATAGFSTISGLTGQMQYINLDILPNDLYLHTGGFLSNKSDESYIHFSGNLSIEKKFDMLKLQPLLKYDNFLIDSSEQNQFISNLITITYSDLHYYSTLETGINLFLAFTRGWDFKRSTIFLKSNFNMNYTKEILRDIYMGGCFSSQFFDSPTLLEQYWGGEDNSRTLIPVLCDQYISGSIFLEYSFINFYWGDISSLVQYELGRYQHNSEEWIIYTGPGIGLRLYLESIIKSVVGIDVAYNSLNNEFLFTLTMGVKK